MLLVIFSCVAYTLRLSESAGRAFFLIWICLVQLCMSGIYGIMPGAVGRIYGNKYIGINYGLVYTSQVISTHVWIERNAICNQFVRVFNIVKLGSTPCCSCRYFVSGRCFPLNVIFVLVLVDSDVSGQCFRRSDAD